MLPGMSSPALELRLLRRTGDHQPGPRIVLGEQAKSRDQLGEPLDLADHAYADHKRMLEVCPMTLVVHFRYAERDDPYGDVAIRHAAVELQYVEREARVDEQLLRVLL